MLRGEAASRNLMSDWSSVEAIREIDYRGKGMGRGYSGNINELVNYRGSALRGT